MGLKSGFKFLLCRHSKICNHEGKLIASTFMTKKMALSWFRRIWENFYLAESLEHLLLDEMQVKRNPGENGSEENMEEKLNSGESDDTNIQFNENIVNTQTNRKTWLQRLLSKKQDGEKVRFYVVKVNYLYRNWNE